MSSYIEELKPQKSQPGYSSYHTPYQNETEFADISLPFLESPPPIERKTSCLHPNRDVFSIQHPATNNCLDYRMFGAIQSGLP